MRKILLGWLVLFAFGTGLRAEEPPVPRPSREEVWLMGIRFLNEAEGLLQGKPGAYRIDMPLSELQDRIVRMKLSIETSRRERAGEMIENAVPVERILDAQEKGLSLMELLFRQFPLSLEKRRQIARIERLNAVLGRDISPMLYVPLPLTANKQEALDLIDRVRESGRALTPAQTKELFAVEHELHPKAPKLFVEGIKELNGILERPVQIDDPRPVIRRAIEKERARWTGVSGSAVNDRLARLKAAERKVEKAALSYPEQRRAALVDKLNQLLSPETQLPPSASRQHIVETIASLRRWQQSFDTLSGRVPAAQSLVQRITDEVESELDAKPGDVKAWVRTLRDLNELFAVIADARDRLALDTPKPDILARIALERAGLEASASPRNAALLRELGLLESEVRESTIHYGQQQRAALVERLNRFLRSRHHLPPNASPAGIRGAIDRASVERPDAHAELLAIERAVKDRRTSGTGRAACGIAAIAE